MRMRGETVGLFMLQDLIWTLCVSSTEKTFAASKVVSSEINNDIVIIRDDFGPPSNRNYYIFGAVFVRNTQAKSVAVFPTAYFYKKSIACWISNCLRLKPSGCCLPATMDSACEVDFQRRCQGGDWPKKIQQKTPSDHCWNSPSWLI